jgi:hypothetical protein
MPVFHHAARTADRPNAETLRARAACDHLWLRVYHEAYIKIVWAGETNAPTVWIRLLFPFDDDHMSWCERIHGLWKSYGFGLRPGGPAGPAADIIRLDREHWRPDATWSTDNPLGL